MLQVLHGSLTRQEIMQRLDLRHDEHFRTNYLRPAIGDGLVELTLPDKPTRARSRESAGDAPRGR